MRIQGSRWVMTLHLLLSMCICQLVLCALHALITPGLRQIDPGAVGITAM